MEQIIQNIYEQAKAIGACDYFTGKERTLEDIVTLLKSNKGREFCMQNRFPSLATFRLFKPFEPEKLGVYIDRGVVTLHNPKNIVLVGRTTAVISYDSNKELHKVMVMQGASAVINAAGWSVVRAEGVQGARIVKNVRDNAVIL